MKMMILQVYQQIGMIALALNLKLIIKVEWCFVIFAVGMNL